MVIPHHFAHWYPTAAYLYILGLDTLALAWEYLRRHPDYRLDWLRRARRPDAAHRWGLRLLEDPALDARDGKRPANPGLPRPVIRRRRVSSGVAGARRCGWPCAWAVA